MTNDNCEKERNKQFDSVIKDLYELSDLRIKEVDKNYAKSFISKYHYSKTCSNIVLAIGEFVGLELKNCIVFNYCAGREMANEVYEGGDTSNVLELSRMVSLEPKPKNLESYCISRALKYLKEKMPNIKVVISYADNTMGHHGYCYQASGFTYYGQSRTTTEFYVDNIRTHERTLVARFGTASIGKLKEMLGDRIQTIKNETSKSRYYYILAKDKREKKEIQKNIKVESLPYPKGDNLRYEIGTFGKFATTNQSLIGTKDKTKLVYQMDIFDL